MLRSASAIFACAAVLACAACAFQSAPANAPGVQLNDAANSPASFQHQTFSTAAASPDTISISTFNDLPRGGSSQLYFASAVALGPDGNLWVADNIDQDYGESALVAISRDGKRQKAFHYPNQASPAFLDLATGPDGNLWVVDSADGAILRVTTHGRITTFPCATNFSPVAITAGPDAALWYTAVGVRGAGVIVHLATDGKQIVYTGGISSYGSDIAAGPDGALWFTEPTLDRIGRISTSGAVTEFANGITQGAMPLSIVAGSDGALWFTESGGGRIGRITTAGAVTEFSAGISPHEQPNDIAALSNGTLWFTESVGTQGAKIARITTSGTITEFSSGLPGDAQPTGIVAGPTGRDLWFVDPFVNRVGRVNR